MTYIPTIPETHIKQAAHRLPKSGKTRFHDSITDVWSGLPEAWIALPNCPWNRRAKDGEHPLIAGLKHFSYAIGRETPQLGKMPSWWKIVHKEDTEADWIRRETDMNQRYLEQSRIILKALMEHVEWKDWTAKDVELCLKAMPVYAFQSERHEVMKSLLESGLPVHLLTHMDQPITPVMWSLMHNRYSGDVGFWIEQNLALDPPGDGPGALSVLLLVYHWLSKDICIAETAQKMIEKGADIHRVGCPREWRIESSSSGYRFQEDTHLLSKTLLGQAQSLGHAGLIGLLAKHPHARDEARAESAKSLIQQHGQQEQKKKYANDSFQPQDYIASLWEVLNYDAVDVQKWHQQGQSLADDFLTHVWGNGSLNTHPLAQQCWTQLVKFIGQKAKASNRSIESAMENALDAIKPSDIKETLNLDGFLSQIYVPRQQVSFIGTLSLVKKAMSYGGDGVQDKIRAMIHNLLGQERLIGDPLQNKSLTLEVMGKSLGGISLPNLSFLVTSLEQGGWTPTEEGWNLLRERIHSDESDSGDIISMLSGILRKHGVPFPYGQFLIPPTWSEAGSKSTGYSQKCEWNREVSLDAYEHFKGAALLCIEDFNTLRWNPSNKQSLLQNLAAVMLEASDYTNTEEGRNHCERLGGLLNELIARGADPLKDPKNADATSSHWMDELDRDHPFVAHWSERVHQHLQNTTQIPSARPRTRRM